MNQPISAKTSHMTSASGVPTLAYSSASCACPAPSRAAMTVLTPTPAPTATPSPTPDASTTLNPGATEGNWDYPTSAAGLDNSPLESLPEDSWAEN